jgi:hypothetical protein
LFGLIKCHRCNHIWTYTGNSITTICPDCKTTVRIPKCLIPINWDFDISAGEIETQRGLAIPFIDLWENKIGLKFYIVAADTDYGHSISFNYPIISGLVTQDEMRSAINKTTVSGRYPLTTEMTEKLKRMTFK